MSRRAIALCSVVAIVFAPDVAAQQPAAVDRAAVTRAIETFFQAVSRGDAARALAQWAADAPDRARVQSEIDAACRYRAGRAVEKLAITSFVMNGTVATVSLEFHGRWSKLDEQFDDERTTMWAVRLHKQDGAWRWWTQNHFVVGLAELLVTTDPDHRTEYLLLARLMPKRLIATLIEGAGRAEDAGAAPQAVRVLKVALEVAEALARDDLRAQVLRKRGETEWIFLGRPDTAEESLKVALALALRAADQRVENDVRSTLAAVLSTLPGRADAALQHARSAVAWAERVVDRPRLALAQNMLGMALRRTGRIRAALRAFAGSAATARKIGDEDLLLQAWVHVATMQFELHDPGAAELTAGRALQLGAARREPMLRAKALNTLGLVSMEAGRFADAATRFQACIDTWGDPRTPSDELRAMALSNLGEAQRRQGHHRAAGPVFLKAIDAAGRVRYPIRAEAIACNNLGMLHRAQGELAQAGRYYVRALANARKRRDRGDAIWPLCNLAELKLLAGEFEAARLAFQHVLVEARGVASPAAECAAQFGIGVTYLQRKRAGDLDRAVVAFECAAERVEQARETLRDLMLQQGFFAGRSHIYSYLVDTLLRLGRNQDALAAAERARARSLVDVLRRGRVQVVKHMTLEERQHEQDMEQSVAELTARLAAAYDTSTQDEYRAELLRVRSAMVDFRRGLFHRHPELCTLRGQPGPTTAQAIGRTLFARDPKLCVLSYTVDRERVRLFALTGGELAPTLAVHTIEIAEPKLRELVDEHWRGCATAGGAHRTAGAKLFSLLLGPVADAVRRSSHLVIVPDGVLHRLPFHALIDPRASRYLVADHTVSYAPSVTALVEMKRLAATRRESRPAAGRVVAFGGPRMPEGYAELPGAVEEAEAIAKLFGVRPMTGDQATETRVKAAVDRADLLHFATHGRADEARPMYSYLVFGRDARNDGLLHAREIADMTLRARLVVLSACETGSGKEVRGEGLVGLGWAFLVAGVPAQLVSQWQVADAGTKELMVAVYRELATDRGLSPAAALRRAQLAALRSEARSHPYFWAPFFLVGAW
ncbi:MAG: CHAT domain-containing protein [Planctomycetes bacterium]|nr:CHAT domain-containing protein [Planctomycetota bacterium]